MNAFSQSPLTEGITKKIIRSVSDYTNTISCREDVVVAPELIATLFPSQYGGTGAEYMVLWHGSIGCNDETFRFTNISIVKAATGANYVVDPLRSSPVIQFESPAHHVDRIVESYGGLLILEGYELVARAAVLPPKSAYSGG